MAKKIDKKDKPQLFVNFERIIKEITSKRGNPLLTMFYSDPAGKILPFDIEALEKVLDDFLKSKKKNLS